MTKAMEQLYYDMIDKVSRECDYREKLKTLAQVKVMLSKELEELCDSKDVTALLEVYQMMDSERHSLHEKAMFEVALSFGMELGRLQ